MDSLLDEYDLGIDEEERRRKTLEESRRRRQAILEKHRAAPATLTDPQTSLEQASSMTLAHSSEHPIQTTTMTGAITSDSTPISQAFSLVKDDPDNITQTVSAKSDHRNADEVSAAEHNADADRAQELAKLARRQQDKPNSRSDESAQKSTGAKKADEDEYEEIEVTDEDDDDEMDMFALSDDDGDKSSNKAEEHQTCSQIEEPCSQLGPE